MIHPLKIVIPKNLNEAVGLLSSVQEQFSIIAGGTDIITGLNQGSNRFKDTKLLIDINRLKELKGIKKEGNIISIGGAETFSRITGSKIIREKLPLLAKACSTIGSVQIRNRATIAGNFVNNAPCADTVPVLLIYNALLEIESSKGKREIPLSEFLNAPYKTELGKEEIVTRINIPLPKESFAGDFYKLGRRRAVAISRITLALLIDTTDNTINEIRIASGAITPIGTRFPDLEKYAAGQNISEKLLKELASALGGKILEITGLRWSSEYKLPVVQQAFYQLLNIVISGKQLI